MSDYDDDRTVDEMVNDRISAMTVAQVLAGVAALQKRDDELRDAKSSAEDSKKRVKQIIAAMDAVRFSVERYADHAFAPGLKDEMLEVLKGPSWVGYFR